MFKLQDKGGDLQASYCTGIHCLRCIPVPLIYLKIQLLIGDRIKFLMRVTRVMRESYSFVYESIFLRRLTGQMVLGGS